MGNLSYNYDSFVRIKHKLRKELHEEPENQTTGDKAKDDFSRSASKLIST